MHRPKLQVDPLPGHTAAYQPRRSFCRVRVAIVVWELSVWGLSSWGFRVQGWGLPNAVGQCIKGVAALCMDMLLLLDLAYPRISKHAATPKDDCFVSPLTAAMATFFYDCT